MILPKAADYIEADFNEAYFTESKYKESRKKHADDISEKISPFKFCIADFFKEKSKNVQDKYVQEIEKYRK